MTCIACNGTGKAIDKIGGGGVGIVLKTCPLCTQDGAPKLEKAKKRKSKVTSLPQPGTPITDILKEVGSVTADAFVEGAKQKAATEAALKMAEVTKQLVAHCGIQLPPHPVVDRLVALATPVLLLFAVQTLRSHDVSFIPPALLEGLNATSQYALKGVSQEAVNELAELALPVLMQYVAIGAQSMAGQLGAGGSLLPEGVSLNQDAEVT